MAATTTFTGPEPFVPDINNPAQSWYDYRENYKIYATATKLNSADTTHAVQVANFLYFVGRKAKDLYDTFEIPIPAQGELTLQLIFDAFDAHYAPYKNLIAAQYSLFTTKQLAHQTFDDFLTILKAKARHCELGASRDTILCTLIAMGISNDDLRKRILSKPNNTLPQVAAMCQADEASARHSQTIEPSRPPVPTPGADPTLSLDAVYNRQLPQVSTTRRGISSTHPLRPTSQYRPHAGFNSPPPRFSPHRLPNIPAPRPFSSRPPQPRFSSTVGCRNCGTPHQHQPCPAATATCFKCGKYGHWANLCRSTSNVRSHELTSAAIYPPQSQYFEHMTLHDDFHDAPDAIHSDEIYSDSYLDSYSSPGQSFYLHSITACLSCDTTTAISGVYDEWYDVAYLTNTAISFKLDTGSQVNLLPQKLYESLTVKPQLSPSMCRILSYSGHLVPILGTITLPCLSDMASAICTFYVTTASTTPILGAQATVDLGFITRKRSFSTPPHLPHSPLTAQNSATAVANDVPTLIVDAAQQIVDEYPDCFDAVGKLPGQHNIKLKPNAVPFITAAHRIPQALHDPVRQELTRMCSNGIITPVHEPTEWVNGMVIVVKPDNSLRICLDPRELNKAIIRIPQTMPTAQAIFSNLHDATLYTVLDAKTAFWQIELDEPSSFLCTFNTPFGRFRFLRLPYGICTASEIFQQAMYKLYPPQLFPTLHISTDDFLLHGKDSTTHHALLRRVLDTARLNGLKFSKSKLQLAVRSIRYLGHIISPSGIHCDPDKTKAIDELPSPTDRHALQRFLGMVNFLAKFLPNHSQETAPLRLLLRKDAIFQWDSNAELVFQRLKKMLTDAPVLAKFDPKARSTISVDASQIGIGAVLLQNNKPIEYASTTFNSTQQRYSQIEKELLAIVYACERFNFYVAYTNFTVQTDHKPLTSITGKPLHLLSPRLQRLVLRLMHYNLTITYVPGTQLPVADTLSRAPRREMDLDTEYLEGPHATIYSMTVLSAPKHLAIQQATSIDTACKTLLQYVRHGWPSCIDKLQSHLRPYWPYQDELHEAEGLLYRGDRLIVPGSMRHDILTQIHVAHQGVTACLARAKQYVFWPSITKDVTDFVRQCAICRARDPANLPLRAHPHPIPTLPWETVGTDLFQVHNKKLILLVDYFSKFIEATELTSTTALSVVKFLNPHFARYGAPQRLVSDGGPPFQSQEFKHFLQQWGVEHVVSSPHYPQSNGMAERTIQTVKNMIMKTKSECKDLQYLLMEYRSTPIGKLPSPTEMLMGRRIRTPLSTTTGPLIPHYPTAHIQQTLHQRQAKVFEDDCSKRHLSPEQLHIGDAVLYLVAHRTWQPATIIGIAREPHSYTIQTSQGVILRRTRSHLRLRPQPDHVPSTVHDHDGNSQPPSPPALAVPHLLDSHANHPLQVQYATPTTQHLPQPAPQSATPRPTGIYLPQPRPLSLIPGSPLGRLPQPATRPHDIVHNGQSPDPRLPRCSKLLNPVVSGNSPRPTPPTTAHISPSQFPVYRPPFSSLTPSHSSRMALPVIRSSRDRPIKPPLRYGQE